MLKKLVILFTLLAIPAHAQLYDYRYGNSDDIVIQPRMFDATPGDGIADVGTYTNPYVIKDRSGNTLGTIQPRMFDATPNDGLFDAGTYTNPYVIKRR